MSNVGKIDAKKHMESYVNKLLKDNTLDSFSTMLAAEML